ncbi:hypothetical protein GGR35_001523 [Mucilaginibacter phyllosphaerae]|uniref:Uncharacterized protein n=1 Tax=Mucilaginibacter phyllosphaerae TaxID=1812349 RepID=A0ABR6I7Y6_9SPHI|nr:hypothetical protein [Mucilaginibacter phyllosphaerae]
MIQQWELPAAMGFKPIAIKTNYLNTLFAMLVPYSA